LRFVVGCGEGDGYVKWWRLGDFMEGAESGWMGVGWVMCDTYARKL